MLEQLFYGQICQISLDGDPQNPSIFLDSSTFWKKEPHPPLKGLATGLGTISEKNHFFAFTFLEIQSLPSFFNLITVKSKVKVTYHNYKLFFSLFTWNIFLTFFINNESLVCSAPVEDETASNDIALSFHTGFCQAQL